MAAEKYLSTQTSILLAGAMIAGALYLGLRAREPAPAPAPPPPAASTAPTGPGAPALAAPPTTIPAPAATPAEDRAAAVEAATKAMEQHRAAVVEKCLKPALAKNPDPPGVKLTFNITFGPDGKQVMRGVREDRKSFHEGVSTCAMDTIPELRIPAQGTSVYVEIPWVLP